MVPVPPNNALLIIVSVLVGVVCGGYAYVGSIWVVADRHTRLGMRGGLSHMGICSTICYYTSLLVSSVGVVLSIYLHVMFTPGVIVIVVFASFNVSVISRTAAFLKTNRPQVFMSTLFMFLGYTSLMLYTLYIHPVGDTVVNNNTLLWVTHLCNLGCVMHCLIFDIWIWQYGWWHYLNLLAIPTIGDPTCNSDSISTKSDSCA